jgi:hypothetical protein
MDSWVWDEVGLEFSNIDIEGTVESERSSQRGDDLSNESVQVGVSGSFNIELSSADIIDSFVINHGGNIGMFQKRVGTEDSVVWFNDGIGDLGGWVNGVTKLGFLAVIDGKSFQKEGTETGTSTTSDSVENTESLKTGTVVS